MNTRAVGARGEALAAAFLIQKGWKIIDRNPHLGFSEIDILADDHGSVVVVEVKAKANAQFGLAVEMITPAKKKRLARLAERVAQGYNRPVRVDVIAIDDFSTDPKIQHFVNALE